MTEKIKIKMIKLSKLETNILKVIGVIALVWIIVNGFKNITYVSPEEQKIRQSLEEIKQNNENFKKYTN